MLLNNARLSDTQKELPLKAATISRIAVIGHNFVASSDGKTVCDARGDCLVPN